MASISVRRFERMGSRTSASARASGTKASKSVGMGSLRPAASTRVTSTAIPRLWREPLLGSAT